MKISIIIPVYNEEKTIGECLRQVNKSPLRAGVKKEIIVINDGSKDNSKLKIENSKFKLKIKNFQIISYKKNRGKGYAVRQGLKKASGDYVLIQDGDLEYDPRDYSKLIMPVIEKKAEVVYGSRFSGERRNMFFWHMVGNKLLSLLTNMLYNSTLSDMEVGYKLIPAQLLKNLFLKEDGFGFEPEATAKILKKGIRIYEVPISYTGREFSEGKKITWWDGMKAVFYLFKYRLTD